MTEWPEIPGLTSRDGVAVLPRAPEQVARGLGLALGGAATGLSETAFVLALTREARVERSRAVGLARWLPLSHVAAWDASGGLWIAAGTTLAELALRFSAWAATQVVPVGSADAARHYSQAVGDAAEQLARLEGSPAVPGDRPRPASSPPSELISRGPQVEAIQRLIAALDRAFLERKLQVRLSLLALLAGQHVLLLGPPGTAKSALARSLCGCFDRASYFEYLLSRFTHPDELFGPVSIPGLKAEDYRRLTEGFLPTAEVAFLDEIFKANSAILNSLLTLVNERVFHHGRHRDAVPLIGLVGASNELPDPDGGLEALYDRFLVRLTVPPLGEAEAFLAVASGQLAPPDFGDADRISATTVAEVRAAARSVRLPPRVAEVLVALWQRGQEADWGVSDRRWRQAVQLVQVAAVVAGRGEVAPLDLLLLEPVLAPAPDRAAEVREVLHDRLARRALPTHDLRAQWFLLGLDRVALVDEAGSEPPAGDALELRLARRRAHLVRFLAHHRRAVAALAADRERVDREASANPFLVGVPAQLVSEHLASARELSKILAVAERYRVSLESAAGMAGALVAQLPEAGKRRHGFESVCMLRISEAGVLIGLTLAGEREVLPDDPGGGARLPTLACTAAQWVAVVEGRQESASLLDLVPVHAMRSVATAVSAALRALNQNGVPQPPALPPLA